MYKKNIVDFKIKKSFRDLKKTNSLIDNLANKLVINRNHYLLTLSKFYLNDEKLIEQLTYYRNKYKKFYPTQFKATFLSTKEWIKKLLVTDNRIMFLLINKNNEISGIIGLSKPQKNYDVLEIDNVIRFKNCKEIDIFSQTLKELIRFIKNTLFIDSIQLKVMSNNERAIKFYKKNNFSKTYKIPLTKKKFKNKLIYIEEPNVDLSKKINNTFFFLMTYKEKKINNPKKLILTGGPSISYLEISNANRAISNGWNFNHSEFLNKLETNFSSYLGSQFSIATSSCTGAIHIGLLALGVKKGDEVIVPDFSWVATARAVQMAGAEPIFCDVEKETWNMCPKSLSSLINKRTKVVIPVHMYGEPAKMEVIKNICDKNNIKIIEDAAPAIGAIRNKKKCGTFGDFSAFSFQGAKLLVAGEGGLLTTKNQYLYKKAKKISEFGRNQKKTFWIDEPGLKYKMSNIQAAVAVAQLSRVDEFINKKRTIFEWYKKRLSNLSEQISMHSESKNSFSTYWMSSALLGDKIDRNKFIIELRKYNIDSRPTFPKISEYPIWGKIIKNNNFNASLIGSKGINLPSGLTLNENQVDYICEKIKKII
jgi:perosamine synthetase|tara:strand:+ start:1377 stop:3152 length:1776 start_codon:yes stop_codon:yes gene_type:complete